MTDHEYPTTPIDSNIQQPLDKEELIKLDQEKTEDTIDDSIPDVVDFGIISKTAPPEITENDVSYHSNNFGCLPLNYYKYIDKSGLTVFYIVRWDFVKKEQRTKEVRPYIFDLKKQKWVSKGFPGPRPLYNLLKLIEKPDYPVLIVEGEKTVQAAEQLFPDYVVITSCGGASAANQTDWSVLEGRDIIIAPDNGTAGNDYGKAVLRLCQKSGYINSVKFLYPKTLGSYIIENSNIIERKDDIPEGYDLADSLAEGWTTELINQAINDERFAPFFAAQEVTKIIKGNVYEGEEVLELKNHTFKLGKKVLCLGTFIEDKNSIDGKKQIWITICGHLKVTHHIRDIESGNWGILVQLIDIDGKKKDIVVHKRELVTDKLVMSILMDQGLEIYKLKDIFKKLSTCDLINDYINSSNPLARARGVDKVGWHNDCYIMPFADDPRNVYFIGDKNQDTREGYILQSNAANPRNLTRKGTLEGWKNNIGRLAAGNNSLMFSCTVALSAPLLKNLGEEGCCFHFSGSSSIGKTTTLYVASSVWGMGKPSSFRTTDNAAESLCKNSNDGLVLMDEIAEIDSNSLEKITYLFGNGSGKGRSKRNGDAQVITTFRILGLSAGEIGLQAKLTEKGKSATAGQSVRFIEIPADSGKGFRVFDTLHEFETGGALSDHLRKTPEDCGVVIDEFMKYIISNFEDVKMLITNLNESWLKKYLPINPDPQVERVAKKFAFIASVGEIAVNARILPFEELAVSVSCKILFDRWLEQRGSEDSHEFHSIIERLKILTQEGVNSRFLNADGTDENKNIREVAGYKKLETRNGEEEPVIIEFWILPDVFKREILQNRNERFFYKQLIENGYIVPDSKNKTTQNKRVSNLGQKRFIVVSAAIINS